MLCAPRNIHAFMKFDEHDQKMLTVKKHLNVELCNPQFFIKGDETVFSKIHRYVFYHLIDI